MQKQIRKYLVFIILIFILVILFFTLAAWWNPFFWHIGNYFFQKETPPVPCPIIPILCPDGSSVAPGGPKCEVPACPVANCVSEGRVYLVNDPRLHCCDGLIFQLTTQSGTAGECVKPTDQTASWKTYTNTEYGFEFKYPDELILKNAELIYGCGVNLNGYGMYLETEQYGEVLNILVTCGTINTTSGIPVIPVIIGNKSGYEYSSAIYNNSNPPVEIQGTKAFRDMIDLGNNKFIQIDFDNRHTNLDYINKIISTFKFTK